MGREKGRKVTVVKGRGSWDLEQDKMGMREMVRRNWGSLGMTIVLGKRGKDNWGSLMEGKVVVGFQGSCSHFVR